MAQPRHRRKRSLITREIIVILLVKFTLLFTLWYVCFSHPLDKKMIPANIASHIYNIHLDHPL